jgi:hypothetical protein
MTKVLWLVTLYRSKKFDCGTPPCCTTLALLAYLRPHTDFALHV